MIHGQVTLKISPGTVYSCRYTQIRLEYKSVTYLQEYMVHVYILILTGNMFPNERLKAWQQKRMFFLTPQVVVNDLSRGTCPAEDIKCVVVDEAHKALGNHAYCQVTVRTWYHFHKKCKTVTKFTTVLRLNLRLFHKASLNCDS